MSLDKQLLVGQHFYLQLNFLKKLLLKHLLEEKLFIEIIDINNS